MPDIDPRCLWCGCEVQRVVDTTGIVRWGDFRKVTLCHSPFRDVHGVNQVAAGA